MEERGEVRRRGDGGGEEMDEGNGEGVEKWRDRRE